MGNSNQAGGDEMPEFEEKESFGETDKSVLDYLHTSDRNNCQTVLHHIIISGNMFYIGSFQIEKTQRRSQSIGCPT